MTDIFLSKTASNVETVTLGPHDPMLMKYKDQIFKIIQQRYGKDLGMQIIPFLGALKFIPDELFHKLLRRVSKVILTIDKDSDTVLAISGIKKGHYNRVKLFALKPLENISLSEAKTAKQAVNQQIQQLFSGNNFMELSTDLFDKMSRMYKLYKKSNPGGVNLYVFPAWTAAKVLPGRNIYVTENGVIYEKKVHKAGVTAKKILIGSVPVLAGIQGYSSINEASEHAKYAGKLLKGKYGGYIDVKEFNPELWNNAA